MEHQWKVKSVEKTAGRILFCEINFLFLFVCFIKHHIPLRWLNLNLEFLSCSTTSCWTCFTNPMWEEVYRKDLKRQSTGLSARFLPTGEFFGPLSQIKVRTKKKKKKEKSVQIDWLKNKQKKLDGANRFSTVWGLVLVQDLDALSTFFFVSFFVYT